MDPGLLSAARTADLRSPHTVRGVIYPAEQPFGRVHAVLVAEHGLDLEIFLETEDAVLATIAGLLVAAERNAAIDRRAVEKIRPARMRWATRRASPMSAAWT